MGSTLSEKSGDTRVVWNMFVYEHNIVDHRNKQVKDYNVNPNVRVVVY